jgi:HAD superfamily hydrolase (TIGR01490 family)
MEALSSSYLVFCDLDHTLLGVNSGRVLVIASRRYRLLPLITLISAVFNAILHRLKLVSDERMIKRMGEWLQGMPAEKMSHFIKEIIQKELLPEIRPQLAAELAKHKGKGARIYILSSAIEEVCQSFVENLGLDGMICTRMERRDGQFTGKTLGPFCFGTEKKNEVLKISDKQQINLAECWYYADDIHDIPVFEIVGHPVCVNPGKPLSRIARQKGWLCLFY